MNGFRKNVGRGIEGTQQLNLQKVKIRTREQERFAFEEIWKEC